MKNTAYLLVNFGGPRNLEEIPSFLKALLTDQDVLRTNFPKPLHKLIFSYVAKKRAPKITPDYLKIGGRSPIYEDTEAIAKAVSAYMQKEVLTFHRYLPSTHKDSLRKISSLQAQEIRIFPLFPQFSYATTGSIARFFAENLPSRISNRMRWIKSYPTDSLYIAAFQKIIQDFLHEKRLSEKETTLVFSAHGLPKKFIDTGEVYQTECIASFHALKKAFPACQSILSYQSKFGRGEWLRPYTDELCQEAPVWNKGRKNVVFIPLSFTSDHIETLFEIEYLYLPIIREKGFAAFRCPSLNQNPLWIEAISSLLEKENNLCINQMLIFSKKKAGKISRLF
ncbi:MAG: ferrochelatase [Simkaniaceae bacterium]